MLLFSSHTEPTGEPTNTTLSPTTEGNKNTSMILTVIFGVSKESFVLYYIYLTCHLCPNKEKGQEC